MNSFKFIADSDIHFGKNDNGEITCRADKINNVDRIIETINNNDIKFMMVCGDLTNHGWDGKKILCWKYGGSNNEYGVLIKKYVEPIKNATKLYLCAGNHDTYVPWPYFHKPVFDCIKKMHGDTKYSFDIENVHFVCCHIYPEPKMWSWLKNNLENNKEKEIVLFYHFNMIGPYSNWWDDNNKDELVANKIKEDFYQVIKDYKIIAIICGHFHSSYEYFWHDIKVISVAGSGFALCTYDAGNITVSYINT